MNECGENTKRSKLPGATDKLVNKEKGSHYTNLILSLQIVMTQKNLEIILEGYCNAVTPLIKKTLLPGNELKN